MAKPDEHERAEARSAKKQKSMPRAVKAWLDETQGCVIVELSSGRKISFDPRHTQDLQNAKLSDLREIKISPSGFGLYFPRVEADLYLPAILKGTLGSKRWSAARLGRSDGSR
jgi:hypothetical protein